MSSISFEVPADLSADRRADLARGWFAGGYDGSPVASRRTEAGTKFTLKRAQSESGYLCVPWHDAAGRERVVSTATLRPHDAPYPVLVELARGVVNRLRTFVSAMSGGGLPFPAGYTAECDRVVRRFGRLVLGLDTDTGTAVEVIETAGALADRAAAALNDYRLRVRKEAHGPLVTRLGCRLSRLPPPALAEHFADTLTAVRIVPDWRAIEPNEAAFDWSTLDPLVNWAVGSGLAVSVGPLVDLADGPFPEWLDAWHGDLPNLAAFLSDFVATVVTRYRDQVRSWHVFAGFNHLDAMGLVEDDRLRLAARTLETVHELEPKADCVFSVCQPWGDYLTNEDLTYAPLVFADTLLRAGYQVSGIELELLAQPPRGCPARDPLDVIRLTEMYDHLGLPLEVAVATADPEVLRTCVAAPTVRGVYWDSWAATDPCSRASDLALVRPDGTDSDMVAAIRGLRKEWLR